MLMKFSHNNLGHELSWMDDVRREFDLLMGGISAFDLLDLPDRLRPFGLLPFKTGCPRIESFENETQVGYTLEIPGIPREDLQITIEGATVQLRAERSVSPPEGYEVVGQERPALRFEHTVTIPAQALADTAQASLEDGVLHLVFEKEPKPEARKIEIA